MNSGQRIDLAHLPELDELEVRRPGEKATYSLTLSVFDKPSAVSVSRTPEGWARVQFEYQERSYPAQLVDRVQTSEPRVRLGVHGRTGRLEYVEINIKALDGSDEMWRMARSPLHLRYEDEAVPPTGRLSAEFARLVLRDNKTSIFKALSAR